MIDYYKQYMSAGFKVFGLYILKPDGSCSCDKADCHAPGKHPIVNGWQITPNWSSEQLDTMCMLGHFDTGFGVIVNGFLVIDVDARNGGCESFSKLCADLQTDLLGESQFAVSTGSGGGSMHIYYQGVEGKPLMQHHNDYPGIDFKSSGFVVGANSLHASGSSYTVIHGDPTRVTEAPDNLLALLDKPAHFRAEYRGESLDVTIQDIADMLAWVSPTCDHDTWIKCGMAIHHATNGEAFEVWDNWSRQDPVGYSKAGNMANRWHSFGKGGKGSNTVTIGTLIHHAESGGWTPSVTFNPAGDFDLSQDGGTPATSGTPFATEGLDLLRPPGFIGDVVQWVNDQCRFPRENLAVGAVLAAMGAVCGLRYTDDIDGVTTNLLMLGVAGSGTGKEAVQQAMMDIHRAAGIQAATHGAIKSEKEIYSNLIRNQAANYIVDELGIQLSKIANASKSGASYHEGTMGTIMSAYTKANSYLLLNGDTKEEVRQTMLMQLAQCKKARDENEDPTGGIERRIPLLQKQLEGIDNGLDRPFLSLAGFTTPSTFDHLVTPEQVTNGFMGRSTIFIDRETNPVAKRDFKRRPMGTGMELAIRSIYGGGVFDPENRRVENYSDRVKVSTTAEAKKLLDSIADWAWLEAEKHKEHTGYEALPRRAREMVSKISLILACPDGLRNVDHVRWAFALVKRDVDAKAKLALSNEHFDSKPDIAIRMKIRNLLTDEQCETNGVLINKCKKWNRTEVEKVIASMVEDKEIEAVIQKNPTNNRPVTKWSLVIQLDE